MLHRCVPKNDWSSFVTLSLLFLCNSMGIIMIGLGLWLTISTAKPLWFMNVVLPGMFCLTVGAMLCVLLSCDFWKMRHRFRYTTLGGRKGTYVPPQMIYSNDDGVDEDNVI